MQKIRFPPLPFPIPSGLFPSLTIEDLGLPFVKTMEPVLCKIGNEKLIRASDSASLRLKTLLTENPKPQSGLRLSVIGGGCSGLQYDMTITEAPTLRDILVETNGVRLIVDPKSALYVSGSVLDYSDDLQKGGFQVTNPNATAHCSCGQSFSV